jgi:uncharacterized protein (DUF362 family)
MSSGVQSTVSRRNFLRYSLLAGISAYASGPLLLTASSAKENSSASSRVALTAGDDRANLTFKGLSAFQNEIRTAIGNRRVIIKPNNVAIDNPLCASDSQCLEGILEFLKSIQVHNVAIAESAANGPTLEGFDNYGYTKLAAKYGAKLMDLDQDEVAMVHACDETDFQPHGIRVARTMLDPNNFIISAAKLKTHDRVLATLSLKNVVVGAPIKDAGFRWDAHSKPGAKNDKPLVHGSGFRAINYNLFALAKEIHPHLAVIDGYEGMEGNGPVSGTAVQHRVAVVSLDWLAADRVSTELMGIDFSKIGYLNYCGKAGMGQADLSRIEIIGEPIARHIKKYRLSDNIEEQLIWMKPVRPA